MKVILQNSINKSIMSAHCADCYELDNWSGGCCYECGDYVCSYCDKLKQEYLDSSKIDYSRTWICHKCAESNGMYKNDSFHINNMSFKIVIISNKVNTLEQTVDNLEQKIDEMITENKNLKAELTKIDKLEKQIAILMSKL